MYTYFLPRSTTYTFIGEKSCLGVFLITRQSEIAVIRRLLEMSRQLVERRLKDRAGRWGELDSELFFAKQPEQRLFPRMADVENTGAKGSEVCDKRKHRNLFFMIRTRDSNENIT